MNKLNKLSYKYNNLQNYSNKIIKFNKNIKTYLKIN